MSITSQDETARSQPHRRIERILNRMSIMYESEYPFPPYSVDIYLGEWHLGVEVDGPAHSPAKDARRDDVLREKYFLPVMHLKTSEALTVAEIMEQIEEFIKQYAETAEQRKFQWRQG